MFLRAHGRPPSKGQVVNMCTAKVTGNQPDFMLSNEHDILSCGWNYFEGFGVYLTKTPTLTTETNLLLKPVHVTGSA